MDIAKQVNNEKYSLFVYIYATNRLESRSWFISSSQKIIRYNEWQRRLRNRHYTGDFNLTETLMKGYNSSWTTRFTCSNEQQKRHRHSTLHTSHFGSKDSRLHVVEPPRERSFIWQIGVNTSIQDRRQVDRGFLWSRVSCTRQR